MYISVFCLTKRFVLQNLFFRTKKGTSEKILQSAFALCDVSYSQILRLSSPFFDKNENSSSKSIGAFEKAFLSTYLRS